MGFSESTTSIAYGGGLMESPHNHQQSLQEHKHLASSPVNKQSSIFSLTLDEFQLKSGKSVGSMNMDEFLTNLWNNVDENQGTPQRNEPAPINNRVIDTGRGPTLARQNSFSIPIQLCKKTVEEVWSEIQKDQPHRDLGPLEPPQRQQTFGEITLEDFLIKAGVVQEPAAKPCPSSPPQSLAVPAAAPPIQSNNNNNNNNTCLGATFGMGPAPCSMMALGFSTQPSMGSNLLVNGYTAYPIYTAPTKMVGEIASNVVVENEKSQAGMLDQAVLPKGNRKRIIDGPHEVVVERKQRRMIKNRESAARSRARKQAYTVELELELTQLKEENDKLKEAVKELEQKRLQQILKRKKHPKMARKKAEKLRALRRVTSCSPVGD